VEIYRRKICNLCKYYFNLKSISLGFSDGLFVFLELGAFQALCPKIFGEGEAVKGPGESNIKKQFLYF
jgi:hypothetical protein